MGSSGKGILKSLGSNFAIGNIAKSAGGLNLWWMMGSVGGVCGAWRKGGKADGRLLNCGKEARSLILSARARL